MLDYEIPDRTCPKCKTLMKFKAEESIDDEKDWEPDVEYYCCPKCGFIIDDDFEDKQDDREELELWG